MGLQTKKKGKLSIKMAKGYKLKSLEIGKYTCKQFKNKSTFTDFEKEVYAQVGSEMVYQKVKNNSTITLSTNSYYLDHYNKRQYFYSYDYTYTYINGSFSDSILAPTLVKVTYIDKYTKKE